jgi:hypothetical protein
MLGIYENYAGDEFDRDEDFTLDALAVCNHCEEIEYCHRDSDGGAICNRCERALNHALEDEEN